MQRERDAQIKQKDCVVDEGSEIDRDRQKQRPRMTDRDGGEGE